MKRAHDLYRNLLAFLDKLLPWQRQSHEPTSVWSFLGLRNQQELQRYEAYLEACSVPRDTTYYNIGVGVYQGEAVVIRQWGFGGFDHQWMVYKLPDQNLNEIPDDMSQSLLCLASLLAQSKKQPDLWMHNLQTKYGQKLMQWYPQLMQYECKSPSSQDEHNNLLSASTLQKELKESQPKIEQSQICLGCPFRKQSNIPSKLRQ